MECPKCQHENRGAALFCGNCGKKLVEDVAPTYEGHVKKVSVFFFVLLVYIAIIHFSKFTVGFGSIILTDIAFALIVVVFAIINYSNVRPLVTARSLQLPVIFFTVISACAIAFFVSVFADMLNRGLFDKTETAYYQYYSESPSPLFFTILSVGVVPAVFEEIAFRGILFTELQMVTNTRAVIFITSFLFTMLHFSLISVLWLFPGALALGYLRAKYNTISYGILAHFIYNTSIVLIQYFAIKTIL